MRSSIISSLFVLLAGCSLFNAPDRDRILDDAGVDVDDVGVDAPEPLDGGPDVPFDAGPTTDPEICDDSAGADEDEDGLSNCADFDCAGDPFCCDGGMESPLNFNTDATVWKRIGSPRQNTEGIDFPGDTPSGVVQHVCFPMAQGAEFSFFVDLHSEAESDCDATPGAPCSDFVAFFVSSVTEASDGSRIVAEMGVTLYASGLAELYSGRNTVVGSMPWALPTADVPVTFRLSPDLDGSEAVLRTQVSVGGVFFEEEPTFPQNDLIRECAGGISGLHFGVEGVGTRIRVLNSAATEGFLECTNPTQFEPTLSLPLVADGADSTRVNLGWTGDWTAGDVTHPELLQGSGDVWHVYGSTGSQQLDLSYLPNFVWSMGHSLTTEWNVPPARSWVNSDEDLHNGLTGQQPTVTLDALGEPLVVGIIDDELHYCFDNDDGGDCVQLNITCDGLANPSIVRAPAGNYLLLYQCREGSEDVIYSQPIGANVVGNRPERTVVFSSRAFGDLAHNAIIDFDVLLDERVTTHGDGTTDTDYFIRAWFVGEALGNIRTLLLATASLPVEDGVSELDTLGQGYRLVSYAGNPIATANVLFRDSGQSLQGVSVERNGSARELLFLFGRRTERSEGRLYDFVPVEQTWGTL